VAPSAKLLSATGPDRAKLLVGGGSGGAPGETLITSKM